MSLRKAIEHGKEKRKPYRKAKAWVKGCRNHGSCGWCQGNRQYTINRDLEKAEYDETVSHHSTE